jgi:serine/threonine protein kinase
VAQSPTCPLVGLVPRDKSRPSIADVGRLECQQPLLTPLGYASAPNDVWSLGIILVNLTCGCNPWQRASVEDPAFQAYLRDSDHLRNILSLSLELNEILKRIFDCDPERRISLPALRFLVSNCPRFTTEGFVRSPPPGVSSLRDLPISIIRI